MALKAAIGTFTIPAGSTAAISPSLSWRGAGGSNPTGITPQAILFFAIGGSVGTGSGNIFSSQGMTDGTRHYCQAAYSGDNVNATVGFERHTTGAPLLEIDATGAVTGKADFTSFGSDTFTVTPSDAYVNATTVFYIALAGFDNVKVQNDTANNTNTNFSITGVGFQPASAIFMGNCHDTLDSAFFPGKWSLGFVASTSKQVAVSFSHRGNGATSNYTWGIVKSGTAMIKAASSFSDDLAVVSFDADGATFSHASTSGNSNKFAGLYLKGGAVGLIFDTARTGTGTFNIGVTGIDPVLVLGLTNNTATASQSATVEGGNASIGALTHSDQWAIDRISPNLEVLGGATVTDEFTRTATDKFMLNWGRTGANTIAATGEITKSSLASELVTLDQVDADTALTYLPIFVLGDVVAAAKKIGKNASYKFNFGKWAKERIVGFRSGISSVGPVSDGISSGTPSPGTTPYSTFIERIGYWLRRRMR